MKTYLWSDVLETGFPSIDEQHQRLLVILDRVAERAASSVPMTAAEIADVVGQLADYARGHFDTEVRLMLDANCDLRHVHKHVREHEDFIRHISLVQEALDDARNDEGAELANYLARWFTRHIVGSDLSMSRQLARIKAGIAPGDAYQAELSEQDARIAHLAQAH